MKRAIFWPLLDDYLTGGSLIVLRFTRESEAATEKAPQLVISPKIRSLVQHAFDLHDAPRGPMVQRLAIPHTFQQGLAGPQAALAIAEAFLRIIFGSVLFAVWGTLVWWSWGAIQNIFLRVIVASTLAAAFLPLMLAMMIVISLGARAVSRLGRKTDRFP